jgi:hypothetical protein
MGEPRVLPDGSLVLEIPDGRQARGSRRLMRENRQAAVDLHRVGGDDLSGNALRDRLGDG